MPVSILVSTPHAAFGELLRISLEDGGLYQVRLVHSAQETRTAAAQGSYSLAILDSAMTGEPFVPLCRAVLDLQANMRLLIIPPENNPGHPSLDGLVPHGYISRPFYLPDMLETVSRLLDQRDAGLRAPAQTPAAQSPWLQDPTALNACLERELAGTQALAGLIGSVQDLPGSGRHALHAWSGQLSEEAAQELAGVIFRYWNHEEPSDLMRFLRLAADKREYLVYAAHIIDPLVLILAYDARMPLSKIRPQTKAMALNIAAYVPVPSQAPEPTEIFVQSEAQAPAAAAQVAENPPAILPSAPGPATQTLDDLDLFSRLQTTFNTPGSTPSRNGWEPEILARPQADFAIAEPAIAEPATAEPVVAEPAITEPAIAEPATAEPAITELAIAEPAIAEPAVAEPPAERSPDAGDSEEEDEEEGGQELPNLSELLGAIPPPNPPPASSQPAQANDLSIDNLFMNWNDWQANAGDLPAAAPQESNPAAAAAAADTVVTGATAAAAAKDASADAASKEQQIVQTQPARLSLPPEPEINPLEDTRPHVIASLTSLSQLEPISPALSQLNYTCVLLPRLPQHYLSGALADRLAVWVQQICLAYAWRLESISIRPEYLRWAVQVAPTISPGNLVRIIRLRTSQYIFSQFATLREQNPSGDFWSPGYLIVSGALPPANQLLRDYITQTRTRQGVLK